MSSLMPTSACVGPRFQIKQRGKEIADGDPLQHTGIRIDS